MWKVLNAGLRAQQEALGGLKGSDVAAVARHGRQ